ncbi:MAG TPA: NADH-quinone oxidoreductase subunit N [Nocardioidaceae bacterium]|nr:NADH-quinone oxidoreductase subunit N [Nocardioidaceae bacterium]
MSLAGFDWLTLGPTVIVGVAGVVLLLGDAFAGVRSWTLGTAVSLVALVGAAVAAGGLSGGDRATMCTQLTGQEALENPVQCSFVVDDTTIALWWIILAGAALVVLMAAVHADDVAMPPGEFHFLLLSSVGGALTLAASRDLVSLVVSLELVSLPSIALVALRRGDRFAARSAWTFFLASVTATAITLMGVSLVYGVTRSVFFDAIRVQVQNGVEPASVLRAGVVLTLAGLVFKIGAVPFHMWVPDTYAGAPVPVAAYLSVVSKTAGIAGLLLVLSGPFGPMVDLWSPLVAVIAGLTMTVGNIAALRQTDAVGLLAWSSVAQAGFVVAPMVALLAGDSGSADDGLQAAVRYLGIYAVANLAAFAVVAHVKARLGRTDIEAFRGLLRTDRLTGLTLVGGLLALAGFPPAIIGLLAKYVALRPVIFYGDGALAVVMAVNVMIGLAYYLRFLAVVVAPVPSGKRAPVASIGAGETWVRAALGLSLAALVLTSLWPELVMRLLVT